MNLGQGGRKPAAAPLPVGDQATVLRAKRSSAGR